MGEGERSEDLMAGFWLGDWLVEPSLNRMTRNGEDVAVEPKVMDVLVCLARQPGRTVTKDFFFETVWDGMVVTEDVLSRCISELRKNLGDDSRDPVYIETIRKTGYRLLAPVTIREPGAAADQRRRQPSNGTPAVRPGPTTTFADPPVRLDSTRPKWGRWVIVAVGLLLIVGGYLAYPRFAPAPQQAPPTPVTTPYTSLPGMEVDPTFSPDGLKIAFASDNNGRGDFDIYIKQEGSDQALRVTENKADERYPSWSPDGLYLAFVRSGSGANAVYTIPSLGGQERKVADFGGSRLQGVSWSPDGTQLAVSAQHRPFGSFSIFVASIDTVSVKRITIPPRFDYGDVEPVFSPNGKDVAFIRGVSDDAQDVFILAMESGLTRQLTFDSVAISGLDWMPDAKSIVFASQRSHSSGLWRVPVLGGEPISIASAVPGASYEKPSVSKDGERLTYVHRSSNVNIWRLFKPSGFPTLRARPAVFSTHWDSHPDISPDGDRIAFASTQSGYREIWVCDADGSNAAQLTNAQARARAPRWSPDGTQIAFQLRRSGQADIYVIDAEGGAAPIRITHSRAEDTVPFWSKDGESIFFSSNRTGRWEIWRIPSSGGVPEQVTRTGGRYAMTSNNGTTLYFVRPDTTGIWRRSLDSDADPRLVYADLDPRDWGNWSVASSGIYFIQRLNYAPALAFYGFQSGKITRLQTIDEVPSHPGLAVARDLSWFAYAQVDDEGSDIMVLENFW